MISLIERAKVSAPLETKRLKVMNSFLNGELISLAIVSYSFLHKEMNSSSSTTALEEGISALFGYSDKTKLQKESIVPVKHKSIFSKATYIYLLQ